MSEYQFVHFLAIDRPLTDPQLEFMRQQSTRAEITRWEFSNEYHFGDFHGNAREMLRRGFDVHVHYANFGIRRVMFRLPAGLPCDRATFQAFQVEHGLEWNADNKGKGGILEIRPQADAGTYAEDVYDAAKVLPEITPIREMLIGGDLRALYLGWLACAGGDELQEPPVPAGLGKLAPSLRALARFYEVNGDLIAAAAERSPAMPATTDAGQAMEAWIARQSKEELRALVRRLLGADSAATRAETVARVRDEMETATWPLAEPARTLAELRQSAERLGQQRSQRDERARQAAHRKRLAAIATDPQKLIANVEKLVQTRSVQDYEQAALELAQLSEALGPERGPAKARAVAEKLRRQNPRLVRLIAALRRQRLLD